MTDQPTEVQIHPDQAALFEQATTAIMESVQPISKARQRQADAELRALDAIKNLAFAKVALEAMHGDRKAAPEDTFDAAQKMRIAESDANVAIGGLMNAIIDVARDEGEL
jgi:hypothetical protein